MRSYTLIVYFLIGICSASEQNLKFDIVFLIDSSKTAEPYYDSFIQFIETLMLPYNVGLNGVRVGLAVVNGNQDYQMPLITELNSISSYTALKVWLNMLKENYSDFNDIGQCLSYELDIIHSGGYSTPQQGYRNDIQNHLLVYITSSTQFNSDPVAIVESILSSKQYGIITVAYGKDLDHKKLNLISGGSPCAFSARNAIELNSLVKPIQRHILHADATGGTYCMKK